MVLAVVVVVAVGMVAVVVVMVVVGVVFKREQGVALQVGSNASCVGDQKGHWQCLIGLPLTSWSGFIFRLDSALNFSQQGCRSTGSGS